MPTINPTVTIDLTEYGRDGRMIIDEPTIERSDRLQRTILHDLFTREQREEYILLPLKDRSRYMELVKDDHTVTFEILHMMSYIAEAPIPLGDLYYDYDGFMGFATKDILTAITRAMEELALKNPFALMDVELDIEMGKVMYMDAFLNKTSNDATAYFMIYGQYLAEGGRKEDWMKMTRTDLMLMAIAKNKTTERNNKNLAIEISNAIGKSMNGNTMENVM